MTLNRFRAGLEEIDDAIDRSGLEVDDWLKAGENEEDIVATVALAAEVAGRLSFGLVSAFFGRWPTGEAEGAKAGKAGKRAPHRPKATAAKAVSA